MTSRVPPPLTLPPSPMSPPSTRKRTSLRVVLATSMGGLLVVLLAGSIGVQYWLHESAEQRQDTREHYATLGALMAGRSASLIDQEAAVRGYVLTGDARLLEPYEQGKRADALAEFTFDRALEPRDRATIAAPLAAFESAADRWRREVATPQVAARRAGPLEDQAAALDAGKRAFDEVRGAHASLTAAVTTLANREIGRLDERHVDDMRAVLLLTFGVFLAGSVLIRVVLRKSVEPLEKLTSRAEARQRLSAPDESQGITELYGLSRALFDLDSAARDRERIALEASAEAAALGGFGEFVQQLADDTELHGALARTMQERIAPTKLHILVRNAAHNRLDIAWPEGKSDDKFKFPILAEPARCRAVRTMQVVTSAVGAPTCCKCALGVPNEGSYHCVPMLAAGELVGVVNLQASNRAAFAPELQQLSQSYISFASTTLSSIRLLAATRERALRDPLTQAYNRSFLSEYLGKQLSQAARRASPISLLMLDLDHFKQLNDSHGHQVGDRALTAFADCLHEQVRGGDAVIRYGGEEFVVLLLDADSNTAIGIAERIRKAVEKRAVASDGGTLTDVLRCSIGVATYPGHGDDEAALIAAADRALYRAKANGRNNVVLATDEPQRLTLA